MTAPRRALGWYPYLVLIVSLYLMVAGTGVVFFLVAALKPIAADFGWPRSVPSLAYALQFIGGGLRRHHHGLLAGSSGAWRNPLAWAGS